MYSHIHYTLCLLQEEYKYIRIGENSYKYSAGNGYLYLLINNNNSKVFSALLK